MVTGNWVAHPYCGGGLSIGKHMQFAECLKSSTVNILCGPFSIFAEIIYMLYKEQVYLYM